MQTLFRGGDPGTPGDSETRKEENPIWDIRYLFYREHEISDNYRTTSQNCLPKCCSLCPLTAVLNEDYPWDVNSLHLQTIVTGEDPGKEYREKD